ncbi:MAG: kelch repeat-containing protein [Candidatus Acidiferrales bacterium]
MLISIRPRKHSLVLYSFLFANLALLSACGGSYNGGNNSGGGSQQGAPIIAATMPPSGIVNSAYSFIFAVSSGGQAPFSWSETGALPAGLTLASNGKLSGTPTASGSFPITVKVEDSASQTATKDFSIEIDSAPSFRFSFTGSMATPRFLHTATLLSSGHVLVAGGKDDTGNATATAELYDPGTGTFSAAANTLTYARFSHTATLLNDGNVLFAGGTGLTSASLSSAEIYDPGAGTFSSTAGTMTTARSQHTDTLLNDGTVLIAGGVDASGNALDTAEIYHPATQTFTATAGKMTAARFQHTATILDAGAVLLTGGVDATGFTTATAEIYDPTTGNFTPTDSMSDSRAQHSAIAIGLGSVLVAGGYSSDAQTVTALASGQSYNSSFTPLLTNMVEPRAQYTITSLGTGIFVLTGGAKFVLANCGNNCVTWVPQSLSSAEGFSSFDLDFFPEVSMNIARRGHTATLLGDGSKILIVGGANSTLGPRNQLVDTILSSAELFH